MNHLTESAIIELRVDQGIVLDSLTDLHHILEINRLADIVLKIQRDLRVEAILDPQVRVKDVVFKRLSMGACDLLDDTLAVWFKHDRVMLNKSFGYLMAHADTPVEVWNERSTPRVWRKAIKKWMRTQSLPYLTMLIALGEFQKVEDEIMPETEDSAPNENDDDKNDDKRDTAISACGPVIKALCTESGHTPTFMTWHMPMEEVELLMEGFLERHEAVTKSKAVQTGKAIAPDPDNTFIRQLHDLRVYIRKIITEKKRDGE